MDRFFSMDNKFFTFMGKVADLFILNILCLICCIPIVTAGASITAMFYVTMKMVKNEEAYIIKSFFKSFKQNFKQATVINLIMLVLAVILYVDMSIVKQMGQPLGQIMNIIFLAFSVLYVMVFLYIYPVLAKFYNSTRNTFINAVLMSVPDGSSLCMSDHSGIFCTDIQDAGDDRTYLSCDRRGSGCILQFIFPG